MALQWIFGVAGALVALVGISAFVRSRRLARRLERLAESYWELRYEQGQMNARIARLEGAGGGQEPALPGGAAAFVPLSSLKKT